MDLVTFFMFLALAEQGADGGGGGGVAPGPIPGPIPGPTPGPGPFVPPPPGVLPGPFPSPVVPSNLPVFPGSGWVPCATSPTIVARAQWWNPQLWDFPSKTIRRPMVQEQFGGQWITFVARDHGTGGSTVMATEAWCLSSAPGPSPIPPPGVLPLKPIHPGQPQTPEHPGVNYHYTGKPQDPATQQTWANKLANVNPYDINNAWIVRMFEWSVGLTQANYPGVDSVTPSGTDGRYGHDVHAALATLVTNPPPVSASRPAWWGATGTYTNPGEPPPPTGGIPQSRG